MEVIKNLNVSYHNRKVGKLALYQKYLTAFEYDRDWLENGFSISPFSLPLRKGVFIPKADPFEGLFGVFADSLPDGFGRLLVEHLLLRHQINPRETGIRLFLLCQTMRDSNGRDKTVPLLSLPGLFWHKTL